MQISILAMRLKNPKSIRRFLSIVFYFILGIALPFYFVTFSKTTIFYKPKLITMPNHFLDVASASTIGIGLLVLLIAITLVEAIVMLLFKVNNFGKCLLDSFVANLVSMLAGYLISYALYDVSYDGGNGYTGLLIAFLLSVLIEGLVVKLMNGRLSHGKIWPAVIVMNLVSYIGLIVWLASI